MRYFVIFLTFLILSTLTFNLTTVSAQEWTTWRGPNSDGTVVSPVQWNPRSLDGGAKLLWRVNVGQGYSSVSVRGRFLYTMGNDGSNDIIYCLDTRTGREIWRYSYSASRGSYPGPRTTPVLDGNTLYAASRYGDLVSLNAANGRLNWQKNIVREHGVTLPGWGLSSSVVIHGDLLIVNAGQAGIALNKNTGDLVWSNGRGRGGYATPVVTALGGKTYAVLFSYDTLRFVEADTGRQIWSYPWRTGQDVNAADPLVIGNRIFISSGYGRGATLLDFNLRGASPAWENTLMQNHFSSVVFRDGFIYGSHGQAGDRRSGLRCLDLETGSERWSNTIGMSSLIMVDDKLIVLTEQGTLIIAQTDPRRFQQLSQAVSIIPRIAWTPPVYSDGMLYIRNDRGDLLCVDLR